jgi:DNA-binding transcriptional MerR regulator
MEKYKISEFANMVGLPQSKIRYYDKFGLFPVKRQENGNRYFTPEDAFRVNAFRMLLTYGFSVEQAISMLDQKQSGDEFRQMMKEKQHELERSARLLSYRAQRISELFSILNGESEIRCTIEDVEDYLYVRASYGRDFRVSNENKKAMAQFCENIALTNYARIINMEEINGDGELIEPSYITAVPYSHAGLLGEIDTKEVNTLVLGKCLVGYHRLTREQSARRSSYQPFLDFIRIHGYQIRSDLMILPMFLNLDGKGLDIEKLIIPIM